MALGTFQGGQPQVITTVNTVPLWRLTVPQVLVSAFNPVGPMPWTGIYSRVDAILQLAAGAIVGYFDNWGMRLYQATLTAIDRTAKTITVTLTNPPAGGSATVTLPYEFADSAVGLPIAILQ